jgi:hypothetical protein
LRTKRKRVFISLAAVTASAVLLFAFLHQSRPVKAPEPRIVPIAAFLSLPSSAVLPPAAATTYVCVRLHKGDLRHFGVDIPEADAKQIVEAEFVLGDDGLARAVRLGGPFYASGDLAAVVNSR